MVERSFIIPFVALAKGSLAYLLIISPIILAYVRRIYHSKAFRAFNNIINSYLLIALTRGTIRGLIPLIFVFLPVKIFIARIDQSHP